MNQAETKQSVRNNQSLRDLIYVAVFTALIAVCSQISVPTPIPFTLQTFAVMLAGGLLGWKRGTCSVLVYILLGIIGVPVFSEFSGGLHVLFGMTGGYIIGFLPMTLIEGVLCDKLGKKIGVMIVAMTTGLAVCYLFGTVWYMAVYSQQVEAIGFFTALSVCVVPYLLFDAAKIAAATVLVNRLGNIIKL